MNSVFKLMLPLSLLTLGLFWSTMGLVSEVEAAARVETGVKKPLVIPEKRIHRASKAGTWYPGDPKKLARYLDELLQATVSPSSKPEHAPIRAMIVPHAAYPYSGRVAAEALNRVKGKAFKRVVVLGPAHTLMFAGLSLPDVTHEETPLGEIPLDVVAMDALLKHSIVNRLPNAHEREHSIEMELPLLQRVLAPGWQLLPVLVGQLNRSGFQQAADALRPWLDEETLLVVSGDFTHYGRNFNYVPFPNDDNIAKKLHELDMGAVKQIVSGDPDQLITYYNKTGITACGFAPMTVLMHLLGQETSHQMVRYETSGGQSGDYHHSVSYIAMIFTNPKPLSVAAGQVRKGLNPPARQHDLPEEDLVLLHKMARRALSLATTQGAKAVSPEVIAKEFAIPDHFRKPSGAFVTLKKKGELRGCIGFIQPIKPLYQAVIENAVSAGIRDWRFHPVAAEELAGLELEVSVLSPMQSVDSYDAIKVGEHGVVLSKQGQQAVYLPEVAREQGWNREQTLSHLARKAGLPANGWKKGAHFKIFTSQKYTAPYQ